MYKNLTYFNKHKSIDRYEKCLMESGLFTDITKVKKGRQETIYKSPEVLISINKSTVNFLVFNNKKHNLINKIEMFSDIFCK